MKCFFTLLLCSIVASVTAQDSLLVVDEVLSCDSIVADSVSPDADTEKLVMVFAGDIMGHDAQILGAYVDSTKSYNYEPTYRYIKDYISAADIAVGNLEVTLAGPPYKGYPQFSSPDELAFEAKEAGFDIMVTANNHSADRGSKGIDRTITMLDSMNFAHAGTYRNDSTRSVHYPLIIEKKGVKIALLNYTYGTNGIVVKKPYIVNRIDTAQMRIDIEKAKLAEPDYIVSVVHWGLEYKRIENSKQQNLTKFMFDNGVDAVIGSHPHVIQPIRVDYCTSADTVKKCPVIYSMGNFVSNQRAQYKDGGVMAELHLSKTADGVAFDSICYMPYWVYREKVGAEKYTFYVLPVAKYENNPELLELNDNDLYRLNRFKNDTRTHLKDAKESGFYKKEDEAAEEVSSSEL